MASRGTQVPVKGISYWCFRGGVENRADVLGTVARAAALGFRSIELGVSDTGALTLATSRSECQALAKACSSAGVAISALATNLYWTSSPASPRQADRERAGQITMALIERAAWLGAGAVVVLPGWIFSPFSPRAETAPYGQALQLARATLRPCVKEAERRRVQLALTNAWGGLPLSPAELAALVDSFRSRRAVACLDVAAAELSGGAAHWITELGRRLALVRVGDVRRRVEPVAERNRALRAMGAGPSLGVLTAFCEPGRGLVPWAAVAAALRRARYRGALTAFSQPSASGMPERAAAFLDGLVGAG